MMLKNSTYLPQPRSGLKVPLQRPQRVIIVLEVCAVLPAAATAGPTRNVVAVGLIAVVVAGYSSLDGRRRRIGCRCRYRWLLLIVPEAGHFVCLIDRSFFEFLLLRHACILPR